MSGDGSTDDDDADWFERALAEDGPSTEEDDAFDEPATTTDGDDWWDEPDSETGNSTEDASDSDVTDGWDETDSASSADVNTDVEPEDETGASDAWNDDGWAVDDDDTSETGSTGADVDPWSAELEPGTAEEDPFDEDFASAFEGGAEEFADEEFESEIPRLDVGIEGLDDLIQGGIPERSLAVAIGSAGTGKTTMGLQFLRHGLQNGEPGVFITLEQSHESIIDTANELGWDFESHESAGDLAIVDLDPVEMANSLDNIRAELPALIEDFGADRFVLDSVSLLEMMYDDQAKRRTQVYDFTRALKEAGVTTFLTSEASESSPYASRFGIIEYLTDAVFILQYVRGQSQDARLAIEIMKIRNANHSRETKPYAITNEGIRVYQQANIF
ncbi:MAG: KaiC domain-containing protein [Salinirussus sp.]